uniref:Uncharacterized protein n=1 Tax=Trichuris muris TaxID=70415 RepID=A0A5S6QGP8_TRIMR
MSWSVAQAHTPVSSRQEISPSRLGSAVLKKLLNRCEVSTKAEQHCQGGLPSAASLPCPRRLGDGVTPDCGTLPRVGASVRNACSRRRSLAGNNVYCHHLLPLLFRWIPAFDSNRWKTARDS